MCRKSMFPRAFAAVVWCALSTSLGAQTTTWTGAASSAWNVAANWSAGAPTASAHAVVPAGTPNAPATAGAASPVCATLVVNAGAVLTVSAGDTLAVGGTTTVNGTLLQDGVTTVAGNLSGAGAVLGAGTLALVGSGTTTFGGLGGSTCLLQIAKTGGGAAQLSAPTTCGGLLLTGGNLQVSFGGSHTLTVNGDATFSGGVLSVSFAGTIAVNGDVAFSGTSCTGSSPTITFTGDWTGGAGYAPASGTAIPLGTTTQTLTGATFLNLTVQAGTAPVLAGTAAISGALTVNGTLTNAGTLNVAGNVAGAGSIAGAGTVAMIGASTASISGLAPGTFTLAAAKTGAAQAQLSSSLTVGGLVVSSGAFVVAQGGAFTLTVNGNATFSGGSLTTSFVGAMTVNGDVTFSGTTCTATTPTINFGGDWTGAAGYAPTGGVVNPIGPATHVLSGVVNWPAVTFGAGTTTSLAGAATINGPLIVDGTLTSSAALTITGNFGGTGTILGGGSVTLAGGSSTTVGGLAPGSYTLGVAKSGGAQALLSTPLTVGGLVLTSGTFVVSQGGAHALTVNGDAAFNGGTLATSFPGTLAIAGDATFAGSSGASPPTILCAGDWTGHPAFAPTTGAITLNGVAPQQILASSKFFGLTVAPGAVVTAGADLTVEAATVAVNAGATLGAGAHRLAFHRPSGLTTLTVNGTLAASAGGALAFGPQTTTTIGAAGTLSLVGEPGDRAAMTHESAAGYAVTVNGTIAAMNFLVESMGNNGLVVPSTATIAAAPHDLRNGIFDKPFSPTACLLNVQRPTPANFRYCAFENSNGVVASNVRCFGGAAVSFTNWSGALADEPFDDDGAANRVTWNAAEATSLAFLFAVPGVSKATVVFRLGTVVDVAEFALERSDAGGPYAPVFQTPPTGLGPYAFVDDPLTALTTYDYRLYQRLTHGEVVLLGQTSATPFVAAPPANVFEVGPGGTTTDLQAAISAAVAAGGQITALRVAPGVYGSFTLTGAPPSGLKIFADGPGAAIDTTNGPVVIRDLPSGSPVELRGFTIGSAGSGSEGLVIENCSSPVLVDEVDVTGGAGLPAIRIATAFAGASVSRFSATGTPGVRVQQSSTAALSAGVVATVELATASYVQDCGLSAAVFANDGTCVRESYAGTAPTFDAPSFASIGTPITFAFQGAPLQYWALIGGFIVEFVPYPQSAIEMPQLLGVQAAFLVSEQFADGTGAGQFQSILPPSPAVLGIALTWQVVALDPSPAYRLSHAVSTIPVL